MFRESIKLASFNVFYSWILSLLCVCLLMRRKRSNCLREKFTRVWPSESHLFGSVLVVQASAELGVKFEMRPGVISIIRKAGFITTPHAATRAQACLNCWS